MKLKINGKPHELSGPMSLLELIRGKNLDPEKIVIEHNNQIIDRQNLGQITVNQNDSIEIVSFVGGG